MLVANIISGEYARDICEFIKIKRTLAGRRRKNYRSGEAPGMATDIYGGRRAAQRRGPNATPSMHQISSCLG
jgi:hypothetical protein